MLTELKLSQFKRFKDEEIDLYPLTLLTGINGMGKSSVIQSLLALRQSFDRGELTSRNQLLIEGDLTNIVSPAAMLSSAASDKSVAFELADNDKNRLRWTAQAEGSSNTLPIKTSNAEGDIFKANLFTDNFQYLTAERIGPRLIYDRLTTRIYHSPLGINGEFTADKILQVLTSNEASSLPPFNGSKSINTVYDDLSFWLSEIVYPGSRVTANVAGATQIELSYTFKEEKTMVFNPLNVGFGFSYALPVILAILIAKKGSLLIVENPEAHLHPKGQSRMGMLLAIAAMNGIQIITETHSDHILNGIRMIIKGGTKYGEIAQDLVKVHFFQKNEIKGGATEVKTSLDLYTDGTVSEWPTDFFDEWENSLRFLIQ